MDYHDIVSRLGLTNVNLELQRVLEGARSAELEVLASQSHVYPDLARLDPAKMAAELSAMPRAAELTWKQSQAFEEAKYRALEMADSRGAIEAAKASMGIDRLTAFEASRALDELVAAAQRPLDLEYLIRDVIDVRAQMEAVAGQHLFDLERTIDALHQAPTIIGAFKYRDFDIERDPGQIDDEERHVILPEEARDRLVRVEFFPLRLMNEIRRRPEMMKKLSSREFEEMTAELLNGLGFEDVQLTPRSRDGGRDVIAVHRFHDIRTLYAFECKQYKSKLIRLETLRALLGTVAHGSTMANVGVLVTTSTFTRGARQFMLSEVRIKGKDFDDLVDLLAEYKRR